jgi:hypothetical protein
MALLLLVLRLYTSLYTSGVVLRFTPAFGCLTSGGCPPGIWQTFSLFAFSEAIIFCLPVPLLTFSLVGLLTFSLIFFPADTIGGNMDWSISFSVSTLFTVHINSAGSGLIYSVSVSTELSLSASMEVTSELGVRSDESNVSNDTDESGNVSNNGGHVKIRAEAALAGMCFDFSQLKVMKGGISNLKSSSHFFPKGFAQPPSVEFVPIPKENGVVVFEDFFHCWPSYTSARCAFGYFLQVSCAATSTHFKCYCANQQIYLGCYVLRRSL